MKNFNAICMRLQASAFNTVNPSSFQPTHFHLMEPGYLTEDRNIALFRMLTSTGNNEKRKWALLPPDLQQLRSAQFGRQLACAVPRMLIAFKEDKVYTINFRDTTTLTSMCVRKEDTCIIAALHFGAVQVADELPALYSWSVYELQQLGLVVGARLTEIFVSIFRPLVDIERLTRATTTRQYPDNAGASL